MFKFFYLLFLNSRDMFFTALAAQVRFTQGFSDVNARGRDAEKSETVVNWIIQAL